MECVICEETKSKDIFNCDGCKNPICKICGGLSASEIKVLELRGKRVMKFHCPRCINFDTYKLLNDVIDSKNANINDKNEIINLLKAQIEEIKKSNENNVYNRTEKSYAGVISAPPANSRPNIPNLIIRPKQNQDAAKTKAEIIKKINPSELNIGIRGMRATGNGNIVITCTTKQEVEDLKRAADGILQNKYEVKTTKMVRPKIKIPGYEGSESEQQIEQSIRKQNEWINDTDEIKVTYVKKKSKKTESTILAECSGATFQKCMKYKKVHIGWNRCPIYEDLSITRCFNCQEFYHKDSKCNRDKVCEYCAGNHEIGECKKTIKKCNNCLEANKKYKLSNCVSHVTSDPDCPSYKYLLKLLKNKIEYNS